MSSAPPGADAATPPDGVTLSLVVDRARGTDAPLILLLPAMGVPARFYALLAEQLATRTGGTVWGLDLPGQGLSPLQAQRRDDFGYADVVDEALPRIVAEAQQRHPGRPVVLAGHSLGGQLSVLATEHLAPRLAGLILLAAGSAHYRSWPSGMRWRAMLTVRAIAFVARLLPWYPGHRLGFGGRQARRWMRDWAHNALHGGYLLHRRDGAGRRPPRLDQVRLPVLALGIDGDPVAPPTALRALLALLPQAEVQHVVVDGPAEDSPWRRHFSWTRRPEAAVEACSRWLREHALGGDRTPAPRSAVGAR